VIANLLFLLRAANRDASFFFTRPPPSPALPLLWLWLLRSSCLCKPTDKLFNSVSFCPYCHVLVSSIAESEVGGFGPILFSLGLWLLFEGVWRVLSQPYKSFNIYSLYISGEERGKCLERRAKLLMI
jgi:hypothetical protein